MWRCDKLCAHGSNCDGRPSGATGAPSYQGEPTGSAEEAAEIGPSNICS